ncbi:uncharacterized protein LOC129606905 [Condylostylus longicornis]|uniref:uncharacterized protein LOC129606905 n=1 Tax=Condylostylus longicornis TaxID=2530218 RepID=UPI00244E3D28|nr:uncharacterized protein LOC129606905 [Condylostylus longicornis]
MVDPYDAAANIGIKTTNSQYQNLINILSDRQDIAHGITRRNKDELGTFWVYVATELNQLGPPTKDPIAWRKVWSDYKSYVKKKLVQNKKEIEVTDGKPRKLHFLNSMEQKVVKISGLEKYIKLVDGNVLISFEEGRLGPATTTLEPPPDISLDIPSPAPIKYKHGCKNGKQKTKEETIEFDKEDSIERYLKEVSQTSSEEEDEEDYKDKDPVTSLIIIKSDILRQNENLEEIITNMKKYTYKMKRFHIALRKLYKGLFHVYIAEKCILRERIRHNREVERIMKRKLRINEQILEIKKSRKH